MNYYYIIKELAKLDTYEQSVIKYKMSHVLNNIQNKKYLIHEYTSKNDTIFIIIGLDGNIDKTQNIETLKDITYNFKTIYNLKKIVGISISKEDERFDINRTYIKGGSKI